MIAKAAFHGLVGKLGRTGPFLSQGGDTMPLMKRKKKPIRGSVRSGHGKKRRQETPVEATELALTPQASPYRPARGTPSGWREGPRGILYYRVYHDGGFEVMGKIRDPDDLAENFAELATVLGQERILQRHKKRRLHMRREQYPQTSARELFDTGRNQPPGVKFKDIKSL